MTPAPESIEHIRECFEGALPSLVATCAPDGTPNVTYVSQIHYVDPEHVALTYQFFSKTRENILANPRATAHVIHPDTGAQYHLRLEYLRTETEGPLFESMKAKLAGIASHTGMSGVFRLLGSDVYRVTAIERVPAAELPPPPRRRNLLASVRATAQRLAECTDLSRLLDETLACLETRFGIDHAMVLITDQRRGRLYTVASRGYPDSGIGSEIPLGVGLIGVAARERTAIRMSYAAAEYAYGRAIRENAAAGGMADMLETEIALPGLCQSGSQVAVPITAGSAVLGVLFVESDRPAHFSYDDEDALVAVAAHLGAEMAFLQANEAYGEPPRDAGPGPAAGGPPIVVRHYAGDDSVFFGNDYLIKGVAGAIFWKLVRDFAATRRTEFSNRELRLDPTIPLPDISDNLEARLILLQRRLAERCGLVRIEKTGRGRFRLCVERPLELVEMPAGAR
jgi:adenylate cyclase